VDKAVYDLFNPEVALPRDYPKLAASHYRLIKRDVDPRYNCIAWAAGRTDKHWWPGQTGISFWPPGVTANVTLGAFIELFQFLGYEVCNEADADFRFEKVAIYVRKGDVQHAARQLLNGRWSSKLGVWWLIEHDFDAVSGHNANEYGDIEQIMRRRRKPQQILSELIRNQLIRLIEK